jgi:hypothetical protein
MKRGILFVSLFLISILIISGCAQMSQKGRNEKITTSYDSPFGGWNQSVLQAFYFFREVSNSQGILLGPDDWVGVFDSEGEILVGARRWDTTLCGGGVCDTPAMGEMARSTNPFGIDNDEDGYCDESSGGNGCWRTWFTEGYLEYDEVPNFRVSVSEGDTINIYDAYIVGEIIASGGSSEECQYCYENPDDECVYFCEGDWTPSDGEDIGFANLKFVDIAKLEFISDYTYGCSDEASCNYATDIDFENCQYPEENYDCDGICMEEIDCAGVCGGSDYENECGTCCGEEYYSGWMNTDNSLGYGDFDNFCYGGTNDFVCGEGYIPEMECLTLDGQTPEEIGNYDYICGMQVWDWGEGNDVCSDQTKQAGGVCINDEESSAGTYGGSSTSCEDYKIRMKCVPEVGNTCDGTYDCDGECIGGYDPFGVCGGYVEDCPSPNIEDECGVCNGPGKTITCPGGEYVCSASDCSYLDDSTYCFNICSPWIENTCGSWDCSNDFIHVTRSCIILSGCEEEMCFESTQCQSDIKRYKDKVVL